MNNTKKMMNDYVERARVIEYLQSIETHIDKAKSKMGSYDKMPDTDKEIFDALQNVSNIILRQMQQEINQYVQGANK